MVTQEAAETNKNVVFEDDGEYQSIRRLQLELEVCIILTSAAKLWHPPPRIELSSATVYWHRIQMESLDLTR